jgi:hypothetical protein
MTKPITEYKVGQKFKDTLLLRVLYLIGTQNSGRVIEFESQPSGDFILEWKSDINQQLKDGTLIPIEE